MNAKDYINQTKGFFNGLSFDLSENPKHLAIIIETREVENFGAIVKNHLYFLPKDFGLLVVHGNKNERFVHEQLKSVNDYSTMNIMNDHFTSNQYNSLLTSYNFWRVINAEKCLVFQTDSLLLRDGIEKFMQWDFIGAPWSHFKARGGNGGLSIRTVSEMQRISQSFKYDINKDGNEDLFFGKYVKSCAPDSVAQQFSVETVFYPSPIGIHACDKYLKPELSRIIFDNALTKIKQTA